MRSRENNSFDTIVVAGDIGEKCALECFKILSTFKCPVVYVLGNHDEELSYESSFGRRCHQIHLNSIRVGAATFAGFSGSPADWGRNPIARKFLAPIQRKNKSILEMLRDAQKKARNDVHELEQNNRTNTNLLRKALDPVVEIENSRDYQRYFTQYLEANNEINKLHRKKMTDVIKRLGTEIKRTILVTHERQYRLGVDMPGLPLHLFGHIHRFSEHSFKGTKYVNVAALDRKISARPKGKSNWSLEDCRNFNAGNYVTIEITSSWEIKVKCIYLPHDYKKWIPLEIDKIPYAPWIPEEERWSQKRI